MEKDYIAVTVDGIEDITITEIKELLNVEAKKVVEGRVRFKTNSVTKLIYTARSIDRVYEFVSEFKFNALDDIKQKINELNLNIKEPFMVYCKRTGTHPFNSQDVARTVGGILHNKGHSVSLHNPNTVVYIDIINNLCLVGIDLTKKDLHKRSYRVKAHHQSVNPCVAYSMLRFADWNADKVLLDPFCKDGVIVIEAAMFGANIPSGYFDRDNLASDVDKNLLKRKLKIYGFDNLFPNLRSAEVNAKLAGVNKLIKFSKTELDWLDVKFDKESIDNIITTLPFADEKVLLKICNELFHQAMYVLKNNGNIVLATLKKDVVLNSAHGFKLKKSVRIKIGGMEYFILIFFKT